LGYKTVIIDDEQYARQELKHYLEKFECIDIIAECRNAVEGVKAVNQHKPDVIFLDIQMPGLSGFDMLSMIEESVIPLVVFVTAYDEYALKAFEENTLDYLLKPIEQSRLEQTIRRIEENIEQENRPSYDIKPLKKIPCSLNNVVKLIDVDDIEFIVSDLSGVHVVTNNNNLLSDLTLKVMEERTDLFRCHRQYMVNLDSIKEIRLLDNGAAEIITNKGENVPVSRRSLRNLKQLIGMR